MDYLSEIAQIKLPFPPVKVPAAKKVFDLAASVFLLISLSPFIFFAVGFFIIESIFFPESRGPLFYNETRISKGLPFQIYKFRIFTILSAKKYLAEHGFVQTKALEQDANNLTRLGKLLKRIYMDELPQIINVLKGEMTLVGPRPSNEVVTYQDGLAGRYQRYLFVCGITGPFQAVKDSGVPVNQAEVDMAYILYCKNNPGWKVVLKDISILLKTISVVIRAKGI